MRGTKLEPVEGLTEVRVLALIPARGGSKGIPAKNLAPLRGRPVLAYSCEAARLSAQVTRAVVSTDDPAIADVARAHGIEVPFQRPAALAADDTPMLDVLRHAVAELRRLEGWEADILVLLQPTSPLRTAAHVDAAIDLLESTGADSVVSVVEVPHRFTPASLLVERDGLLLPFMADAQMATRRQDKARVLARNGPAVLAVRRAVVEAGSLYGADSRPLRMGAEDSVDIDEPLDLELAAWYLERRDRRNA